MDPELLLQLQLTFPPDQGDFACQYGSEDQEPLFVHLGRFQSGLKSLNDAMVGYADLLAQLAGSETVNQAEFDQLAQDVNASAGAAAATLNFDIPAQGQALLRVAAVKIFQAFIEKKRRESLEKAIAEVQPQVDQYSKLAQDAVRFIATGVKASYDDQYRALSRGPAIEKILELNQRTEDTLRTLRAIKDSYARLPAGHKALAAAAAERPNGLGGLLDFTNETVRLRSLFNTLVAANQ